jgi:hypothetical protein
MKGLDLYPSPTEPRSKRRARSSGCTGTSFYIARGLPFVTMREYRDRRRDPDARRAVQLSRELTKLANDFPRFRLALNRLQHHVLTQVRSPNWKAKRVLKVLDRDRAASVRQVASSSGLDFVSVTSTLEQLRDAGKAIACNRAGRPLSLNVGQAHKFFWRRGE